MFPKDAHFICRKCLYRFCFKYENFRKIEQVGKIQCPNCGLTTPEKSEHVSTFFEHYPWFVGFISVMAANGFIPETFAVEARKDDFGHECYKMTEFVSICRDCGERHKIDLENTDSLVDDLFCHYCGSTPIDVDHVKEFFYHFAEVHDSQIQINEFQFELFAQSRLDPNDFLIRHADL